MGEAAIENLEFGAWARGRFLVEGRPYCEGGLEGGGVKGWV